MVIYHFALHANSEHNNTITQNNHLTSHRYLDNTLLLGVDSSSLEHLTGSFIPEVFHCIFCSINSISLINIVRCCWNYNYRYDVWCLQEPMYLVLNTAISHRWGMPEPCPVDQCAACWHCYDCTNPGTLTLLYGVILTLPSSTNITEIYTLMMDITCCCQIVSVRCLMVWRAARTCLLQWKLTIFGSTKTQKTKSTKSTAPQQVTPLLNSYKHTQVSAVKLLLIGWL